MTTLRTSLMEQLRSRVDFAVWAAQQAMAEQPGRKDKYSAADLRQMVDGFYAVMQESLEGGSGETRRFFLETVIPGLMANGDKPSEIAETVVTWGVFVVEDAARSLPGDLHDEAMRWLAHFIGRYVADIVNAGFAASH